MVESPFLTVKDVASLLKITPYTVRTMIKAGHIQAFKISGGKRRGRSEWRIPATELGRLAEGGRDRRAR